MTSTKRVLLVEDDPNDAELTLDALTQCRLADQTEVVRDGVEALDYVYRRGAYRERPKGNPVVVLLDLKLPRVDGIQVLKQLKSDDQLCTIPIVVFTSSRVTSDLDTCYRLGVNGYVVKPLRFDEFDEVIRRLGTYWALTNEPPLGSATQVRLSGRNEDT